jgi:RHS repeat-associated protein
MLPTAEERIPALANGEEIFSWAAGVALAALDTHQGAREAQGKKPHQGIFSKNRALRVGEIWAKYSGTHQVRNCSWSETVSGTALDANGNTLSDASGRTFTWDFENRLTQAVVPGTNGGMTTFKYDPFGRRIQKSGPLGTTNYLYDTGAIVETAGLSGAENTAFTQGPGVDEPLAILSGGTAAYYQADEQSSITSLTTSSGTVTQNYAYDSFGKTTASTGSTNNFFRYAGREFDSETGLYFYRLRYYDPTVGRFLNEDPSGFDGGRDFYPYADNNPATLTDPFGLQSDCSFPGILYTPCGGSLYGPPADPTAPPGPPTPPVPSWWPGPGPTPTRGPSPSPGPGPTPAPSPNSDRSNEYAGYKKRCNEPPPPGLSPCDLARWKLQRNQDCRNMRQDWDDKWSPGRHSNDISNLDRSIANLQAWIEKNCQNDCKK